MVTRKTLSSFETSDGFVYLHGEKIPISEYRQKIKKMKRTEKKESSHPQKFTDITMVGDSVNDIVKSIKSIKSLSAYYDNAKAQWGEAARKLLSIPEIYEPYISFRSCAYGWDRMVDETMSLARRNSKSTYDMVRKLSWKLEDLKVRMTKLHKGVLRSGVLENFGRHECIDGSKKRFGLRPLMQRTVDSFRLIDRSIKKLSDIADKGKYN